MLKHHPRRYGPSPLHILTIEEVAPITPEAWARLGNYAPIEVDELDVYPKPRAALKCPQGAVHWWNFAVLVFGLWLLACMCYGVGASIGTLWVVAHQLLARL